jgi:hypothetical protein
LFWLHPPHVSCQYMICSSVPWPAQYSEFATVCTAQMPQPGPPQCLHPPSNRYSSCRAEEKRRGVECPSLRVQLELTCGSGDDGALSARLGIIAAAITAKQNTTSCFATACRLILERPAVPLKLDNILVVCPALQAAARSGDAWNTPQRMHRRTLRNTQSPEMLFACLWAPLQRIKYCALYGIQGTGSLVPVPVLTECPYGYLGLRKAILQKGVEVPAIASHGVILFL